MAEITITTTDGLDGRAVTEYLGADTVVGAAFDYEEMAEGMLWVNLSGTAVATRER